MDNCPSAINISASRFCAGGTLLNYPPIDYRPPLHLLCTSQEWCFGLPARVSNDCHFFLRLIHSLCYHKDVPTICTCSKSSRSSRRLSSNRRLVEHKRSCCRRKIRDRSRLSKKLQTTHGTIFGEEERVHSLRFGGSVTQDATAVSDTLAVTVMMQPEVTISTLTTLSNSSEVLASGGKTCAMYCDRHHKSVVRVVLLFFRSELHRIAVWCSSIWPGRYCIRTHQSTPTSSLLSIRPNAIRHTSDPTFGELLAN